ncbi:MAG: site-specific DNA-methyltransferase, partial [Chloroflexota bacterium]|nr:site-specific DNA-methyltransferase [Chloroflexota bacterium]
MTIVTSNFATHFTSYTQNKDTNPLFFLGDARSVLEKLADESIDFCMTSPPYWGKRQYHDGGIGLENKYEDYITNLLSVFIQVKRVVKPTGVLWLNIGDSYYNKCLLGIPWRVALRLIDEQGWILRNSVIWNKIKGGLANAQDRVRNIHENIFFFVKETQGYYFDIDAIRAKPRKSKVVNGAIVTATGVTGVRYRRQIEMSTALTEVEKDSALK